MRSGSGQTTDVTARMVVLNGASSSGKSSIARVLQERWHRPLLVTGLDTYIAGWPLSYISIPSADGTPGPPTTGLRIVPGAGPAPSWVHEPGRDFHALMRLAHRAWVAISEGGVDQVIDHVLLDETLRQDAATVLAGALWVGVHCDVDELVRREAARGDRYVGFASGTSAVVHVGVRYDLEVDTTRVSSEEAATEILRALDEA